MSFWRLTKRLLAWLEAVTACTEAGMKHHGRWLLVHRQFERKVEGRRSISHIPALINLVLAPIATASLIAQKLGLKPPPRKTSSPTSVSGKPPDGAVTGLGGFSEAA